MAPCFKLLIARPVLRWMMEQSTIKFNIISILTSPWHTLVYLSGKNFYFRHPLFFFHSYFPDVFLVRVPTGTVPRKRPRPLNEMRSSYLNMGSKVHFLNLHFYVPLFICFLQGSWLTDWQTDWLKCTETHLIMGFRSPYFQ